MGFAKIQITLPKDDEFIKVCTKECVKKALEEVCDIPITIGDTTGNEKIVGVVKNAKLNKNGEVVLKGFLIKCFVSGDDYYTKYSDDKTKIVETYLNGINIGDLINGKLNDFINGFEED